MNRKQSNRLTNIHIDTVLPDDNLRLAHAWVTLPAGYGMEDYLLMHSEETLLRFAVCLRAVIETMGYGRATK